MGFCIHCNKNVFSETTCPKCHKPVSKVNQELNEKVPFDRNSILRKNTNQTDKWQDTYGKKAIFNNDLSSSSANKIKSYRSIPQFSNNDTESKDNKNLKTCACCNEKKEISSSTKFSPLNSSFYCSSCLKDKITCPTCQNHFNESDNQTQYNHDVWHTSCFKCVQCSNSLSPITTVVDKDKKLFCRTCQLKNTIGSHSGHAPFTSSSTSTPLISSLISSRSTLTNSKPYGDSTLERFQKQRRASMLDSKNTLPIYRDINVAPSTSTPPIKYELGTSIVDTPMSNTRHLPEIDTSRPENQDIFHRINPTPTESITNPEKLTVRRKKVAKKPCKQCNLHVSKKDYRGLKIQTGEILCYHKNCLSCRKCQQGFDTLEFCTDGISFYHVECSNLIASPSESKSSEHLALNETRKHDSPISGISRQDSPMSEEDEMYPRTPPPQNTYFNIVSESPTLVNSAEFDDLQKKQDAESQVSEIVCTACNKSVTDTCLELSNKFYHKECLLCTGCNKTVPTERKLVEQGDKLFCDQCAPTQKIKSAKIPPKLKIATNQSELPKRNPTITTPSDIFKSRKTVLPRLGGVRTCARCDKSMPFSDTQPGPNASRWHKKCLRCATCDKQMDSDAHMTKNSETGLCLVHCRECLDDKPKPRFVR